MKIAFIIPPSADGKRPADRTAGCTRVVVPAPNIYELTLAAVLQQDEWNQISYHDYVAHFTKPNDFVSQLSLLEADVFVIWGVNLSLETDLWAISHILDSHPQAHVVMVGPGPTWFTQRYLIDSRVVVVRGEPEATCRELMMHLHHKSDYRKIDGISYLVDGKTYNNKPRQLISDLDAIPFAARKLLGKVKYHNPKLKLSPYTTMITSRNCPYRCIYCVPSSLTFAREIESRKAIGRKPRIGFRSVENVEAEVSMLHRLGYRAIGFMDDNFIWDEQRTRDLCAIMRRYNMRWGCQARVDAITPAIAAMLGNSGCGYVDLGVESFNDEILDYVHKGIKAADIYRACTLLKQHHVPVKLNILIGCSPLETEETVKQTLREATRIGADQIMFNIVSPFPGTEYYDICKKNGWIDGGEYRPTDVQSDSILNLPNLSASQMERLLRRNNRRFFLSARFVFKQLMRFTSIDEFIHALKALRIKLFPK